MIPHQRGWWKPECQPQYSGRMDPVIIHRVAFISCHHFSTSSLQNRKFPKYAVIGHLCLQGPRRRRKSPYSTGNLVCSNVATVSLGDRHVAQRCFLLLMSLIYAISGHILEDTRQREGGYGVIKVSGTNKRSRIFCLSAAQDSLQYPPDINSISGLDAIHFHITSKHHLSLSTPVLASIFDHFFARIGIIRS